ncbi:carboxypeptidase-like regulatory domain-containing protein [Salmonirosea aquatica]
MKRSNYLLKINNPCAESWDKMRPTDSGRFCANCAKNVVDFTHLSDDKVLAIIKNSSGNQCGRLEKSQINRYLVNKSDPSNKSRFYKFFVGVLLLTAVNQSLARNGMKREINVELTKHRISDFELIHETISKQHSTDSLKNVIRGRVVDSLEHLPIPGVTILLEGTRLGTATNEDGEFDLIIPPKFLKEKNALIVSFIGYKTNRLTVNSDDFLNKKSIFLTEDGQLLNEIVYVGDYSVHHKKWWQFWKKKY